MRSTLGVPTGPMHQIFGQIASLRSPYFTLRLRNGRIIDVDARTAVESGHYSAPLFVGKIVLVEGRRDASGVLHGDVVQRQMHIDAETPADR